MKKLFTERHGGAKPRTAEQLDPTTRDALLNLIAGCIDDEWFSLASPEKCVDGHPCAGTDHARLRRMLVGYTSGKTIGAPDGDKNSVWQDLGRTVTPPSPPRNWWRTVRSECRTVPICAVREG